MTTDSLMKRRRLALDSIRCDSFFLDDSDSDSDDEISPIKKIVLFDDETTTPVQEEDMKLPATEDSRNCEKEETESIASIDIETTLRGREITVRPRLTIEEKKKELNSIENLGGDYCFLNQVLACTLWDIDFRYTLLSHQYEAVLAVAGLDMNILSDQLASLSNEEKLQAIDLAHRGRLFRLTFFSEKITFDESKGMLLADEMVSFMLMSILPNHVLFY